MLHCTYITTQTQHPVNQRYTPFLLCLSFSFFFCRRSLSCSNSTSRKSFIYSVITGITAATVTGGQRTILTNSAKYMYDSVQKVRKMTLLITTYTYFVTLKYSLLQLICTWSSISPNLGFHCRTADHALPASHMLC